MLRSQSRVWLLGFFLFLPLLASTGLAESQSPTCEIVGTEVITSAAQAAKYLVYPEGRVVRFGDLVIRFNRYTGEEFYFEVKGPGFHQSLQLKPPQKLLINVCDKEVTVGIGSIYDSNLRFEPPWLWFVSAF